MVFLRQRFVPCNQIMFNLSNTRRLRKTGAIMHIKILSFILNLDLPFYAQFVNPSMTICVVTDSTSAETNQIDRETRCFPMSSPNQKGNRGVCSEFFFIVHEDHILSSGVSFSISHCQTGCMVTRMLFRISCPS